MTQTILYSVISLNIFFVLIAVLGEKKKPESTLAWVLALFFIPYIGVILYIIFGDFFRFDIRKKERSKIINDKKLLETVDEQIKALQEDCNFKKNFRWTDLVLMNTVGARSLISLDNDVKLFSKATDKYDSLFQDIKNAKETINISYYIIRKDFYGKQLLDLLIEKVNEGVEVRLIFDHIGSKITSKKFFKPLIDAGGKVEKFFPSRIFLKLYINHRNHRKMVIIDGKVAYIGGMNIGKEYVGENKRITPWSDKHLRIEGEAVVCMQIQFFMDYLFVSKEKLSFDDENIAKKFFKLEVKKENKAVQIVASGPDYKDPNIHHSYLKMINNAKENIVIETPYFIPDETIINSLKIAIKSGVDVKLIIPGVPDKKMVYLATLSYAKELAEAGASVYAYQGFMHSKLLIVDNDVVNIGSANMDRRSFNLNFEINAIIYNEDFVNEAKGVVEEEISKSMLINEKLKKENIFKRLLETLARLFAPII